MANNKKSDIDIRMLKIFEHANFNFLNISRQKIDLKKNTIEIHDSIMANTYLKNNNLTDIELEELKRIF